MHTTQIRICFIIDALEIGGTEKQLIQVLRNLDRRKFRAYLVCLRTTRIFENINFNCTKLHLNIDSLNFTNFFKSIISLRSFLIKEKIDIVQTFFFDANILGVFAAKLAGVRQIISSRRDMGFWYTNKTLAYLKLVNTFVDRFLVNSKAVKENIIRMEKIPCHKIDVIYNGINMSRFGKTDIASIKENKRRLKIPTDNIVVGFIANLNRSVKRPDVFVKASAIISRTCENVSFLIIGDGHLRHQLIELAKTLDVLDKMVFAGQHKDIASFSRVIDIGVLTSDSEGFPNAILEYMATGTPTVATDAGGNRELIDHKKDGYLEPPGAPDLMAQSILTLINDRKLRIDMGNNAKEKVRQKFPVEKMLQKLENYYKDLYVN